MTVFFVLVMVVDGVLCISDGRWWWFVGWCALFHIQQ